MQSSANAVAPCFESCSRRSSLTDGLSIEMSVRSPSCVTSAFVGGRILSTMSLFHTSAAPLTIVAPASSYAASEYLDASPAPACTRR